jgi:hypothetical protein
MTMIDQQAVIEAINDILGSILGDDDLPILKEIHDVVPAQFREHPAAYTIPLEWEEDLADLRDNNENDTYRVVIVYQLDPDSDAAQREIRETVKLVRTELRKQENITLGGIVDWSRATNGRYIFDTKEQKVVTCQIDIAVRKRFNRFA